MERVVLSETIPGYYDNKDSLLECRSAVRWADKLCKTTPILLMHGTADGRVHPKQTMNLADELFAHQHPFKLVLFEGGTHGLRKHQDEVFYHLKNWMDKYVRDQKLLPDLSVYIH